MARHPPPAGNERARKPARPREVVRPQKVHEQIAGILEQEISEGGYRVGDELPSERELMQRFSVGRPAVRQALVALERIGLVNLRSGKRAEVGEPSASMLLEDLSVAVKHYLSSPDGVAQLQDMRLFFETAIVRRAARNPGEEHIARLERALRRNREAIGQLRRFEETDVAFHFAIAKLLRHPILEVLHEAVATWLTEQRAGALREPGADLTAYRYHAAIFEAIRDRDPDRAEAAMQEHLTDVARSYWATSARGRRPETETSAPPLHSEETP